jgi:sugar lactone lactonase YvrE
VKSFGAGMFVRPHGIHVDREGNVWVTDGEGPDGKDPRRNGKGHQVFKFSPDGKVLMTLGKAGIVGDGPDVFNQPSAVLVAPNGDIFVGDGHGGDSNARVLKFSKDGTFIKAWGKKGVGPGEFEAPHALAMDSRGRLFVGDRGNNRIQIFDQDGRFIEEWKQFSRPSGVYIDKNDILYSTDSSSDEKTNPGWEEGIRIGSAKDGKVVAFILDPDPDGSQEGVAADAEGNVYGSLTGGMALRRFVKK